MAHPLPRPKADEAALSLSDEEKLARLRREIARGLADADAGRLSPLSISDINAKLKREG
ncbi:MAG: hypothetical protein LDL26_09640 [Caenispirillum bisanense]|nr:hypothetical protein [Caenispirillum bisanense]MCA1974086.1 hypothetical protein [Caenispirillum sp.]